MKRKSLLTQQTKKKSKIKRLFIDAKTRIELILLIFYCDFELGTECWAVADLGFWKGGAIFPKGGAIIGKNTF
jgi:hypothetical protein